MGVLGCPSTRSVIVGWQGTAWVGRPRRTVEKSADAVVPAGSKVAGKGRTRSRGAGRACSRGSQRPQPTPRGAFAQWMPRVKPKAPREERSDPPAPRDTAPHPAGASLWERFLSRENLALALRRVERNAGAAGIDGMSTKELRPWLKDHWPQVRSALEAGTYRPRPVRRATIPKPSGGERMLGVPAAVDRLICQALSQVLTPVFDPHFHPHSFGFRPGRSAHQAVERARQFIADGTAWCVDFDLDSFFDRVQHDALMARIARRVADKQVLALIRRYLGAGVMDGGGCTRARRGPRKGPRSARCSPTSCSTTSTGSWIGAVTASCATPTYADIGIGPLMPSPELCRARGGNAVAGRGWARRARHNQSASRNASRVSGGR